MVGQSGDFQRLYIYPTPDLATISKSLTVLRIWNWAICYPRYAIGLVKRRRAYPAEMCHKASSTLKINVDSLNHRSIWQSWIFDLTNPLARIQILWQTIGVFNLLNCSFYVTEAQAIGSLQHMLLSSKPKGQTISHARVKMFSSKTLHYPFSNVSPRSWESSSFIS